MQHPAAARARRFLSVARAEAVEVLLPLHPAHRADAPDLRGVALNLNTPSGKIIS